jgi:hypothetical protein
MLAEAREQAQWSKECEALSMYHELSKLGARRGRKGKRYKLALLLTCVLLAKMAGETTLQAIAEWIRLREPLVTRRVALFSRTASRLSRLAHCFDHE